LENIFLPLIIQGDEKALPAKGIKTFIIIQFYQQIQNTGSSLPNTKQDRSRCPKSPF
jgi:hypothetical protein